MSYIPPKKNSKSGEQVPMWGSHRPFKTAGSKSFGPPMRDTSNEWMIVYGRETSGPYTVEKLQVMIDDLTIFEDTVAINHKTKLRTTVEDVLKNHELASKAVKEEPAVEPENSVTEPLPEIELEKPKKPAFRGRKGPGTMPAMDDWASLTPPDVNTSRNAKAKQSDKPWPPIERSPERKRADDGWKSNPYPKPVQRYDPIDDRFYKTGDDLAEEWAQEDMFGMHIEDAPTKYSVDVEEVPCRNHIDTGPIALGNQMPGMFLDANTCLRMKMSLTRQVERLKIEMPIHAERDIKTLEEILHHLDAVSTLRYEWMRDKES